ncbi:MAG: RNA polymerase subunit sigma-24 [Planctomycetota bacterium]|nr:MAG: RNA polymerase subunit sigma-24 [Planctomycetota bacterium]
MSEAHRKRESVIDLAGERKAEPSRPNSPAGPPDEVLVMAAQAGDRNAFEQLVIRYQDRIFNLCHRKLGCREDAFEASQETFLRAYRAIGNFAGQARFYTWLFRIALNCAFSRRKRRTRRRSVIAGSLEHPEGADGAGLQEPVAPGDGPLARVVRHEEGAVIAQAIASLPPLYHDIVLLRDIEGMSYEDIAETLEIPLGSVKSRLHRARLQLRDKLMGYVRED